MNVADEGIPERFTGAFVSANAFSLIGHAPAIGRGFDADDDRPGAAPVVILSDGLWRTRYKGDRAVIGRTVGVNGVPLGRDWRDARGLRVSGAFTAVAAALAGVPRPRGNGWRGPVTSGPWTTEA